MNHKLISHLVCEIFDQEIYPALEQRYKVTFMKDASVIELASNEVVVLLPYGVVISWDASYDALMFFFDFIREFQIRSIEPSIVETFSYSIEDTFNIHFDTISIENLDHANLCALSHALAQNVKLMEFERKIQDSIEENDFIPRKLALQGSIPLGKKDLSKKIGELFLVKNQINLQYDLLDTPAFFWDYPEYEVNYLRMTKYLDINARLEVLNKRVEVLQELLNMLSHEQNHRYSSILEWIIIGLILFEIILTIGDHF